MEADCLNHEIMLGKIQAYGIRGLSEDWSGPIELREDRKSKQRRLIELIFFDWDTLKHGVPKGQF